MRFILGYIPGTKSRINPDRPEVYWEVRAEYRNTAYVFERLQRDENGLFKPVLNVFDSDHYPDDVIKHLVATNQIVELIQEPDCVHQTG